MNRGLAVYDVVAVAVVLAGLVHMVWVMVHDEED